MIFLFISLPLTSWTSLLAELFNAISLNNSELAVVYPIESREKGRKEMDTEPLRHFEAPRQDSGAECDRRCGLKDADPTTARSGKPSSAFEPRIGQKGRVSRGASKFQGQEAKMKDINPKTPVGTRLLSRWARRYSTDAMTAVLVDFRSGERAFGSKVDQDGGHRVGRVAPRPAAQQPGANRSLWVDVFHLRLLPLKLRSSSANSAFLPYPRLES